MYIVYSVGLDRGKKKRRKLRKISVRATRARILGRTRRRRKEKEKKKRSAWNARRGATVAPRHEQPRDRVNVDGGLSSEVKTAVLVPCRGVGVGAKPRSYAAAEERCENKRAVRLASAILSSALAQVGTIASVRSGRCRRRRRRRRDRRSAERVLFAPESGSGRRGRIAAAEKVIEKAVEVLQREREEEKEERGRRHGGQRSPNVVEFARNAHWEDREREGSRDEVASR